jgi:serine protease AprX
MVPRARASLVLTAVASVVVAGTLAAAPAPAARAGARGDAAAKARPAVPGKGDRDRDKIADDLEAALAAARPGERVRVIVQGTSRARARAAAPSLKVGRTFRTIRGFVGSVRRGQVTALAHAPGVTRDELDGQARALDKSGNSDYGVDAARATGAATDGTLDGSGVGICIIDTGIDPNHEQLAGRVVGWKDFVNDRATPYDDHGHGTHVAGIAAGLPTGPANAAYGGVATGASLIAVKVLDSTGVGDDADVVAGIEWCAARSDVDVISMSLGSPPSDGSDAGSQAANAAVAAGKVVVVAAGNSGDAPGTVNSPGVATDVVTVGAASDPSALAGSTDTDNGLYLAGFSSRGPTTNPAAPTKPDVVAPGLSVVAAKAGTTSSYWSLSGTSMATPFVAGVVALGLEADPAATPAEVKQALHTSAQDAGSPGADNEWGWGLVDARSFVAALGATSAGTAAWPGHTVLTGSVGSGASVDFPFDVSTAGQPLGVTLRTTNGAATCALPLGGTCWYGYEWSPDIDAYLVNPSGTVVAMSRCMLGASNNNCGAPGRFETLGIASAVAGTWKLRVESFSGAGSFAADVFGALGAPPPPPTPPAAPTLSAQAVSTSQVDLSWAAVPGADGYTLDRCTGTGCTSFATIAPSLTQTSFSNTGLAASTSYSYRLRAYNAGGPSDWSTVATAVTQTPVVPPPATPTLSAQAVSSSQVDLSWAAVPGADGYTLDRCTGAGCTTFVTIAPSLTQTSFSNTGLAASTSYSYRLRAYNAGGPSGWSTVATAVTQAPLKIPSTPVGLTGTATPGVITLTWQDSDTETGYRVLRCGTPSCTPTTVIATLPADTISWPDTTVVKGVAYRYIVQAYNAAGSRPSRMISVKAR